MDNNNFNPLEGEKPELVINIHDNTDESISIIIVHRDRPEYLNILLQSIAVNSFNNNYEIIVVDNASGPESEEYLKQIEPDCKIIRNSENHYFSKAANIGVQNASPQSKYFLFLHCDVVILNPAWIDLLVNVSEASNSGVVGVETSSYFLGNQRIDFIQEYCLLVTRQAFNHIGGFPEELPAVGSAFIFTLKAQNGGFKPQLIKNNVVHHYKIFAFNLNDYERFTEMAMNTMPKIVQQIQSRTI